MKQTNPSESKKNEVTGNFIGLLTCDFCKGNIYKLGLFQKDDGKYFLGLNCAKCGAAVTAIQDVQDYAKAVLNPVKH